MHAYTYIHSMHSDIRIFAPLLAAWNSSVLSLPLHPAYSYPFLRFTSVISSLDPTAPQTHPPLPPSPCCHIFCGCLSLCAYHTPKEPLSWGQASCLALLAQTDSPMDFEFLEIGTGFKHLCIPEF